jgi:hypothetical protein
MNLDEAQRRTVADWIRQGLKLSDIQNRLASELGVRLTYMEVRLLVDDLKLTPRDAEPAKPREPQIPAESAPPPAPAESRDPLPGAAGRVSVSVDKIARQGAMVSGKVTFRDGNEADWYLDPSGRLGLAPQQASYRPAASDVQEFQVALDSELRKMGM